MKFNERVYEIVKTIPKGKVMSYKQVAERLNSKAYRAVGTVLKNNPNPKIIPCHRVIKSNGEIGGYFGHIDDNQSKKKEKILRKEGVGVVNGKVAKSCYIL